MNAEKSPVNHNVDHEEIAKFEAVASRWWDLEGPRNASITLSAACRVSASTTPIPCVPSTSLTTSGAPPTISIKSLVSSGECAMPVTGKSMQ